MFVQIELKRDDVGGVFLDVPSALCGFPVLIRGKGRFTRIALSGQRCNAALRPYYSHLYAVSALLADTLGKVCQGDLSL